MTARRLTALPLAAAIMLAVAGCGGSSATETQAVPTATPPSASTATPAATPKPAALATVAIVVDQGQPKGGIKTYTVKQGDRVALVVRTDVGTSVHLHGYNLEQPVVAGKPTRIVFTATTPGRFEIELHETDTLLGNLQVEP